MKETIEDIIREMRVDANLDVLNDPQERLANYACRLEAALDREREMQFLKSVSVLRKGDAD